MKLSRFDVGTRGTSWTAALTRLIEQAESTPNRVWWAGVVSESCQRVVSPCTHLYAPSHHVSAASSPSRKHAASAKIASDLGRSTVVNG
jgi:flavin-binding protein dodecin